MMNFHGLIYRALDPAHANHPLSGKGAAKHAQRFNARGQVALYTATDPTTVLREKMQEGPLQPLLLVAIRAKLTGLFDARFDDAISRFGTKPDAISRDDWRDEMERHGMSESQRFAQKVHEAGFVGMAVPSYAKGATDADVNIVLWAWGIGTKAELAVIDDDDCLRRLP